MNKAVIGAKRKGWEAAQRGDARHENPYFTSMRNGRVRQFRIAWYNG